MTSVENAMRLAKPGHAHDFKYPYKSLQDLKKNSPSRKHGLTEEQEDEWKRASIDLIITVGIRLKMDHLAVVTALEFFHRYYAEHSMVTTDRFLMSMACLYLAGKVADTPKSSRDVISASLGAILHNPTETAHLLNNREWVDAARGQLSHAERALLYQLGFRFHDTTAIQAMVMMLKQTPLKEWITKTFEDDISKSSFSNLCFQMTNHSAKVPLVLQYPPDAVGAGCIWLAMKILRLDTGSLKTSYRGKSPWYSKYDLKPHDLESIAYQVTLSIVSDGKAANVLRRDAALVEIDIVVPPLEYEMTDTKKKRNDGTVDEEYGDLFEELQDKGEK